MAAKKESLSKGKKKAAKGRIKVEKIRARPKELTEKEQREIRGSGIPAPRAVTVQQTNICDDGGGSADFVVWQLTHNDS